MARRVDVNRRLDKVTMLALAALYEVTEQATTQPIAHALQLRATLWLLYQRSNRRREPYAAFWKVMTGEEGGIQAAYGRSTYARTHWLGIVRSLGGNPDPMTFHETITSLIREHHRTHGPEGVCRRFMVEEVGRAELTQEIIATKGHPHSREAWALIEERRVAGLAPDGGPAPGAPAVNSAR